MEGLADGVITAMGAVRPYFDLSCCAFTFVVVVDAVGHIAFDTGNGFFVFSVFRHQVSSFSARVPLSQNFGKVNTFQKYCLQN